MISQRLFPLINTTLMINTKANSSTLIMRSQYLCRFDMKSTSFCLIALNYYKWELINFLCFLFSYFFLLTRTPFLIRVPIQANFKHKLKWNFLFVFLTAPYLYLVSDNGIDNKYHENFLNDVWNDKHLHIIMYIKLNGTMHAMSIISWQVLTFYTSWWLWLMYMGNRFSKT